MQQKDEYIKLIAGLMDLRLQLIIISIANFNVHLDVFLKKWGNVKIGRLQCEEYFKMFLGDIHTVMWK